MGGDVLLAFECTPWRKVIYRNQRRQEKSLVRTACDRKCVSAKQRRQEMSFGEIVVGGKCCREKSGNPRMWESVRCDAVSHYDVICCTFFRGRRHEQGRRISRRQSVVTKTILAA